MYYFIIKQMSSNCNEITFTRDIIDSLVRIDERNKSIDIHEYILS